MLTRAEWNNVAGGGRSVNPSPAMSPDEWEVVAEHLDGADGDTWRGILRGVCRAARDGVERAAAATEAARGARINLRALASRVELLQWVEEQRCAELVHYDRLVTVAVESGSLSVLKWGVQSRGWQLDLWDICESATRAGQLALLLWAKEEWMQEQRCCLERNICREAAAGGQLAVLQAAVEQGYPLDGEEWTEAARGGHVGVLEWLMEQGCRFDEDFPPWREAAEEGQLAVLRWAAEQGFTFDACICARAAIGGQLEVLQWLREQGTEWDAETCQGAAMGGHLEMLQWARQHGYPSD